MIFTRCVLILASVFLVLLPRSTAGDCTFASSSELEAALSTSRIGIDPQIENGKTVMNIFAEDTDDCLDTTVSFRVAGQTCDISNEQLAVHVFHTTVDSADLTACGAEPRLSEDNLRIIYECDLVCEFSFRGRVGRTVTERFTFIRNRLTTATTGIFTPFDEFGDEKTVTDNSLIEAQLTTCVDFDCDATDAIVYKAGERAFAMLQTDLKGVTIVIRAAVLGEYSSSREVDVTNTIGDERTVEGGVLFSVLLEQCSNCFLRVTAEAVPVSGGVARHLLSDTQRTFAYINVEVEESSGAENSGLVIGVSTAGGVAAVAGITTLAVVLLKKKRAMKAQDRVEQSQKASADKDEDTLVL